jgi:hypothetical protein
VALLGVAAPPAQAGQLSVPFAVKVALAADNAGMCRSTRQIGVFGTAVTVDCTTGAPAAFSGDAPDGLFRYLVRGADSGQWLGSVVSRAGPGIVTSLNMVRLSGFEYLELMVTW